MTTNSPNPVDGDVQALIGLCKIEIKRWKAASETNPNMRYMVALMEKALAALTAERCGSLIQAVNPNTGSVTIFYRAGGIESIDPTEVSEWEMQEVEHLYTTPPAKLLRPVELPEWIKNANSQQYKQGRDDVIEILRQQGIEVKE